MATRGSRNYCKRKRSSSVPDMKPSGMERKGPIPPMDIKQELVEPEAPMGQLDVEEKVEDIITLENETALFECKVVKDLKPSCTWHKDGCTLQSDDERVSIIKNSSWHRLEITHVTTSDQGIYTIECRHGKQYISVKGHLYVAPRKINDGVFYHSKKYIGPGVVQHLRNVNVNKGEKITLEATFTFSSREFTWFKNNDIVLKDHRTSIESYKTNSRLTIMNAKPSDAGVYYLVSRTDQGYLSSFADVLVGDANEKHQPLPAIEEFLPDEVEAILGEEVRLIAKVKTDIRTSISWNRNNFEILENDTILVDFGYNYFGLIFSNPLMSSAGEYRLVAAGCQNNRVATTSTKLKVHDRPPECPEVRLLRPLESAMACCGAKVSFDCRFNLIDPIYYYVVWYVGHYKVERTNSHFNVISNGAQYLLYIKKFEPSMAGDVICELRRSYPKNKSVRVGRAYARLVMLPLSMIQEARSGPRPVLDGKLYYEKDVDDVTIRIQDVKEDTRAVSCRVSSGLPWVYAFTSSQRRRPSSGPWEQYRFKRSDESRSYGHCSSVDRFRMVFQDNDDDYLLKIVYCKLDNDGLYFLQVVRGPSTDATSNVKVYASSAAHKGVVIEWNRDLVARGLWFCIELGQTNGSFANAGFSSGPSFTLDNPPIDRMMVFRIKAVEPLSRIYYSEVFITPPPEMVQRMAIPHEIEPMATFNSNYSMTNEIIGAGAFGSVSLVKNIKDGSFYAAKIVKARTEKKREHTLREFNIMKSLRHPKLIELIGFYESKNTFVFVMEYCWGGELFDRVAGEEYLKESDVVGYVKQICEGLEYMHLNGIVHLDLKPENIICMSPNSRQVKLIDFGVARNVNEDYTRAVYGTRDYVAPEVIDYEPITTACDMWSLGVVTYTLLSGLMPFTGDSWIERSVNITRASYDYDDYAFDEVSDLAKNFVDKLLVRKPTKRMTAGIALQQKWIVEGPPQGTKAKHMNKMRQNLKSYLADYRARWQRAGNVMIAAHRLRMKGRDGSSEPVSREETPELPSRGQTPDMPPTSDSFNLPTSNNNMTGPRFSPSDLILLTSYGPEVTTASPDILTPGKDFKVTL